MSIRESFVEKFGEENAKAFEAAANEHENGLHPNQGSDPFKWVLMLVISYHCAEINEYKEHHGITTNWPDVKQWIKDVADLGSYDGDFDWLAAFAGAYDEFMPAADVKSN